MGHLNALPRPVCAELTPFVVTSARRAPALIEVLFERQPAFGNHFGHVQGGFAVAMLDALLSVAVFDGPGEVDPAIRRAVGTGAAVPDMWASYVGKVRDASYRITDRDVSELKAEGCTEEEIFEITVAAATGAALRRLDLGLRAMHGGP